MASADNTAHRATDDGGADAKRRARTRGRLLAVAKAVGITLLALLLSKFLVSPFTATTATLFSSPEQGDFRFSDIFAQFANTRPVRQLDDRIVIVDIGTRNRHEIAETLFGLSLCSPKAVGLDVIFGKPGDDDSDVVAAIASIPGIVMPVSVESNGTAPAGASATDEADRHRDTYHISETSRLSEPIPDDVVYGAVNFPTLSDAAHNRVREYATEFPTRDGKPILSFPMALARVADPMAAQVLADRHVAKGVTAYHSREFTVIPADELQERMAEIEGKTVIVGSLNDAGDMHATPVNSYMPGTIILAHSLATILDRTWYTSAPGWLDYATAAVLCFLIVLLCTNLKSPARPMIVRTLQVVLLYLFVRVGYEAFVEHNTICNFSYTLLMIAFGLFAVDLWNGSMATIGAIRKKVNYYSSRKNNQQCEELS